MKKALSCTLFFMIASAFAAFADEQKGFKSLTDEINVSLELRPRYEYVDVDGGKDAANAVTVRTKLGLGFTNLLNVEGLKTFIEATDVTNFGLMDEYDSASELGGNTRSEYEVIKDPPITRITQAYISYTRDPMTISFGRKELTLDNQRFVGSANWRQMYQTFGVADLTFNYYKENRLYAAYVYERKGIIDEATEHTEGVNSVLANADYTFAPIVKAAAYTYLINSTHNTYGLRLSGNSDLNSVDFNYAVEGALQSDPAINDLDVEPDADSYYYNIEAGSGYKGFILKANYEVLGEAQGDALTGFSTPWAGLHAFHGWGDFLLAKAAGGDPDGLTDVNATIGYKNKNLGKLLFVYHKFDSVENSRDYGSEYDLLYEKKIKDIKFIVKTALYQEGDDFGTDATKFWLMAVYNFKEKFM